MMKTQWNFTKHSYLKFQALTRPAILEHIALNRMQIRVLCLIAT